MLVSFTTCPRCGFWHDPDSESEKLVKSAREYAEEFGCAPMRAALKAKPWLRHVPDKAMASHAQRPGWAKV